MSKKFCKLSFSTTKRYKNPTVFFYQSYSGTQHCFAKVRYIDFFCGPFSENKSGPSSCVPHFLQITCWCWRRCIWGAVRCHESTEQIESSVRLVFLSLFRLGFLCMGVVRQFILCNLSWETVVQQHISFYLRAGVFRSPLDLTRKQV